MRSKFPKITIILRGYSTEQAIVIAKKLDEYESFAIEVAMNSDETLASIVALKKLGLSNTPIGAGTVLDMTRLKEAKEAGADFVLSPIVMSKEMIMYCKEHNMISIPGAFTPSEIVEMKTYGADIVKVFPAESLNKKYIKAIQAPLGELPLMVVGGVNADNVEEYFKQEVMYAGIGSGVCRKEDLDQKDYKQLEENIRRMDMIVRRLEDER